MNTRILRKNLNIVRPDINETLTLHPQTILDISVVKNQTVLDGADGSSEILNHGEDSYYFNICYDELNAYEDEDMSDLWLNKANGAMNSFKLNHSDGNTYVVKFTDTTFPCRNIKLKILGII